MGYFINKNKLVCVYLRVIHYGPVLLHIQHVFSKSRYSLLHNHSLTLRQYFNLCSNLAN